MVREMKMLREEIQSFCPYCGESMIASGHFCDYCKERVATPTDIDVAPIRKETAQAIFEEIEQLECTGHGIDCGEYCKRVYEKIKNKWCGK